MIDTLWDVRANGRHIWTLNARLLEILIRIAQREEGWIQVLETWLGSLLLELSASADDFVTSHPGWRECWH